MNMHYIYVSGRKSNSIYYLYTWLKCLKQPNYVYHGDFFSISILSYILTFNHETCIPGGPCIK